VPDPPDRLHNRRTRMRRHDTATVPDRQRALSNARVPDSPRCLHDRWSRVRRHRPAVPNPVGVLPGNGTAAVSNPLATLPSDGTSTMSNSLAILPGNGTTAVPRAANPQPADLSSIGVHPVPHASAHPVLAVRGSSMSNSDRRCLRSLSAHALCDPDLHHSAAMPDPNRSRLPAAIAGMPRWRRSGCRRRCSRRSLRPRSSRLAFLRTTHLRADSHALRVPDATLPAVPSDHSVPGAHTTVPSSHGVLPSDADRMPDSEPVLPVRVLPISGLWTRRIWRIRPVRPD